MPRVWKKQKLSWAAKDSHFLSGTARGWLAGKATLHGRHDSTPEHADHSSSEERTKRPTHVGEGFGIRAQVDSACQRFKESYTVTLPKLVGLHTSLHMTHMSMCVSLREFKEAHMINSEYLHSAILAMQTSFGK